MAQQNKIYQMLTTQTMCYLDLLLVFSWDFFSNKNREYRQTGATATPYLDVNILYSRQASNICLFCLHQTLLGLLRLDRLPTEATIMFTVCVQDWGRDPCMCWCNFPKSLPVHWHSNEPICLCTNIEGLIGCSPWGCQTEKKPSGKSRKHPHLPMTPSTGCLIHEDSAH